MVGRRGGLLMVSDARISSALPSHPKTKKLIRRLGPAGGWSLVCLFLWTSANRSNGCFYGMSDEDIELASEWHGEYGAFTKELVDVGFLDGAEGCRSVHDWAEHNPWAASADMRSAKARWNAIKRHFGDAEADRLVPEYAAIRNAGSNASSTNTADEQQAGSNAPSPSPSPSPLPNVDTYVNKLPVCPTDEVISLYHEHLPQLPTVRVMNIKRQKAIGTFWKWVLTSKRGDGSPRAQTADQALTWIGEYFRRASGNDFLMGRSGGTWTADLDFLLSEKGKIQVIEKTKVAA
jgi:hypothetical protein